MKKGMHDTERRAFTARSGGCGAELATRRCMHPSALRRAGDFVVLAAILLAPACRSAEPADDGIRIGDKTLEQFRPNETSENWVVSIIGPPTTRTEVTGLAEPTSILRYSVIEKPPSGLFSFFTGRAPAKTTATIYFVVRGGVVTQFWADRETQATLLGGKTEKDKGEKSD
jgi:hypothetical protein